MKRSSGAKPNILVAGVGNIFLGDDAFGVEVVRRLLAEPLPPGVEVIDFGIRGFDLACAITDRRQAVILVDAVCRGGPPGTLYLIEPDVRELEGDAAPLVEGHSLDPASVLRYVQRIGCAIPPLRIVGCEPATFGSEEEPQMGLSSAVAESVGKAVVEIHALLAEFSAA